MEIASRPPAGRISIPDGKYHAIKTDDWGTTWEYRIYGVWGHPIGWPLEDIGQARFLRDAARSPSRKASRSPKASRRPAPLTTLYFIPSGCGDLFTHLCIACGGLRMCSWTCRTTRRKSTAWPTG